MKSQRLALVLFFSAIGLLGVQQADAALMIHVTKVERIESHDDGSVSTTVTGGYGKKTKITVTATTPRRDELIQRLVDIHTHNSSVELFLWVDANGNVTSWTQWSKTSGFDSPLSGVLPVLAVKGPVPTVAVF